MHQDESTHRPGVACAFLSRDELSTNAQRCLLAVNTDSLAGVHVVAPGLTDLGGPSHAEAWLTDRAIEHGVAGDVRWSSDGEELFLSCALAARRGLAEGTRATYRSLLAHLDGLAYRICRIANYIPDIHGLEGGSERYWLFNQGRRAAFGERQWPQAQFPAACAVGARAGVVCVHATKRALRHFENPEQMSAYHYPDQYGPSSPSFARATVARLTSQRSRIYISGTASIAGHQSLHAGQLPAQLEKAASNVDVLLAHVVSETGRLSATVQLLKVYVRRAEHFPAARSFIAARFPGVAVRYLLADLCRRELLVEIEGLAELS